MSNKLRFNSSRQKIDTSGNSGSDGAARSFNGSLKIQTKFCKISPPVLRVEPQLGREGVALNPHLSGVSTNTNTPAPTPSPSSENRQISQHVCLIGNRF